jgi:hypothetical protein
MTAKQLEADTSCKIMVRGRGSMRDKQKVRFKFSEYEKTYFLYRKIKIVENQIGNI